MPLQRAGVPRLPTEAGLWCLWVPGTHQRRVPPARGVVAATLGPFAAACARGRADGGGGLEGLSGVRDWVPRATPVHLGRPLVSMPDNPRTDSQRLRNSSSAARLETPGSPGGGANISGFLQKQTTFGFWHQRWFQIRSDGLYYATEENGQGGKLLNLSDCHLVDASGKKHDFSIHHESGKLHVSANCEELKAAWWSALQKAIQEAKERARDQKPGPQDFTKLALIGRGATGKVLKVPDAMGGNASARWLQGTLARGHRFFA